MAFIHKKLLFSGGLLALVLTIALTVTSAQRQQELRGRASEVCKNVPADVSIIIDKSGSMNDKTSAGAGTTKIAGARNSASTFVDRLAQNAQNRGNLVTYATTATLDHSLTSNFSLLKSKISAITAAGDTCIECGIKVANDDIKTLGRVGVKKAVVLLTDGKANVVYGNTTRTNTATAEQKALAAAAAGRAESGTVFFTIGLGNDVNAPFLQALASKNGGKYYFPPTVEALDAIYAEISQIIAQGSINGTVFNDVNKNGIQDSGEIGIPEWKVLMTSSNGTTTTFITDSVGNFFIPHLCDGSFTVKVEVKPEWTQTVPSNGNGYSVSIANGSVVTGRNFGVVKGPPSPSVTPSASPSPTPGAASLSLEIFLHGVGNSGDNSNPEHTLSNKNPKHKTHKTDVTVLDANAVVVATVTGDINYSSASGSYKGLVKLPSSVVTGLYKVKVRVVQHLARILDGIQTLTVSQTAALPPTHLVAGDANNDNKLDIRDYNMLLNCYSDINPPVACIPATKELTDFNDDGVVSQFDYNLFIRELTTQPGK